jgi:hypothetical protein
VQVVNEVGQLDELLACLKRECADLKGNPDRPRLVMMIDNYDSFSDEGSKKSPAFFEGIAALLRKYQTDGFYVFIAGSLSITSASEELRKMVAGSGTGYALQSPDAVNRLNGRFPRHLSEKDLPLGRAFRIRSSRTEMLQIASPYAADDNPDEGRNIDQWVEYIQKRCPGQRAAWLEGELPPVPESPARPLPAPAAPAKPIRSYDYADLRKKLKEKFVSQEMLDAMPDNDVEMNARALGILPPQESEN